MNYKIIQDLGLLESFVNNWLPELLPHETFYVALLARQKYIRDLGIGTFNSDRYQCKRFLSTKDRLIDKIKQLECPVGSFVLKQKPIPQEALALYITPNPRDMIKATYSSLKKFADLIQNKSVNHNPAAEALSEVHKSVGTKHFVDFDFDNVTFSQLREEIDSRINRSAYDVLETRGGFHLLVSVKNVDCDVYPHWYPNIEQLRGVDQKGDSMIPVPGCTQGEFTPRFIESD